SIAAVPHDTPKEPRGPWAMPGRYTVRLAAGSATFTRPLTVRMDPRLKTPLPALREQFELSQQLAGALRLHLGLLQQIREARKKRPGDKALEALEGSAEERRPWAKQQPPAFVPWAARLAAVYDLLQSTDDAPTPQALEAGRRVLKEAADLAARARAALLKHE
ncbi:MAG TPA: hypothetical protein VFP52_00025, partial [Myxococcales bacterium]|nr:hypothetical protein [Myxococcales bacterium]